MFGIFLFLFLCWFIYFIKVGTDNIQYYLVFKTGCLFINIFEQESLPITMLNYLFFFNMHIAYILFGSYIQFSIVDFLKERNIFVYKKHHENISNNYLFIPGYFQQFRYYIIQWSYSRNTFSKSIYLLIIDIYNGEKT